MRTFLTTFSIGLLAACASGPQADDDETAPIDASRISDATGDLTPLDGGDAASPRLVRFVAIGDSGKGNVDQRNVAVAMRDVCADRGCDFVLMLGDNIYESGVESTASEEWQTKFEEPYRDIDLPFYPVLGNHDYGGNLIVDFPGLGNEWHLGQVEVDYSQVSAKWKMPATHYTFTKGHVGFIMLDTNAIMWGNTMYGDQAEWLPSAIAEVSGKDWVFVAGHHPYRSNGSHGNAGEYDGPESGGSIIPILNGAAVKEFFDRYISGVGAVYFSGHDHCRQWLNESDRLGGTEMIVNGAGATVTNLLNRGNSVFWQDATIPGFQYVTVDGDTMTGEFYDMNGVQQFSRTIHR